jgi:hypothetical protein
VPVPFAPTEAALELRAAELALLAVRTRANSVLGSHYQDAPAAVEALIGAFERQRAELYRVIDQLGKTQDGAEELQKAVDESERLLAEASADQAAPLESLAAVRAELVKLAAGYGVAVGFASEAELAQAILPAAERQGARIGRLRDTLDTIAGWLRNASSVSLDSPHTGELAIVFRQWAAKLDAVLRADACDDPQSHLRKYSSAAAALMNDLRRRQADPAAGASPIPGDDQTGAEPSPVIDWNLSKQTERVLCSLTPKERELVERRFAARELGRDPNEPAENKPGQKTETGRVAGREGIPREIPGSPEPSPGHRALRVYVASSWRNDRQPVVVDALRAQGHEVYDFRHPKPGNAGFHWSDIDPDWKGWTPERYRELIDHPIANRGFELDYGAMRSADVFVLVQPSGRSAHLELGWACGAGKPTCILLADGEPELMVKMVDSLAVSLEEVLSWVGFAALHLNLERGEPSPEPTCGDCANLTAQGNHVLGARLCKVHRTYRQPEDRVSGAGEGLLAPCRHFIRSVSPSRDAERPSTQASNPIPEDAEQPNDGGLPDVPPVLAAHVSTVAKVGHLEPTDAKAENRPAPDSLEEPDCKNSASSHGGAEPGSAPELDGSSPNRGQS